MRSESRASSGVLAEERDCGPDRSRMATGLIGFILGPRQDAVDKGSHGSDGGVLPRGIVDIVPPEGKVGRTLHLASTIDLFDNQCSLTR